MEYRGPIARARRKLGSLLFGQKGEHPTRLDVFLNELKDLEWGSASERLSSLDRMFHCLNALMQHEVTYYYKMRSRKRVFSDVTRFSSFLFGAAGLTAPFVEAADKARFPDAAEWGYVFLAIGAALLGGNRLFGSTAGHIRNVSAQYQLERAMTAFRLEWQLWKARLAAKKVDDDNLEKAFGIMSDFAQRAYAIIEAETQSWGEKALDALDQFASSLGKGQSK